MDGQRDVSTEPHWHLALRLLAPEFPLDSSSGEPQFYVGALPPDHQDAIPLPAGSQINGSYRDTQGVITAALDVPLPLETVIHDYEGQLTAVGWTHIDGVPSRLGGFTLRSANETTGRYGRTYCRSAEGPALMIRAFALPGGATDIRLRLLPGPGPCAHPPPPPGAQPLLPELEAPPDAELVPRFRAGSDEYTTTLAQLVTDLELPAVASHYARQLEAAGWERRVEETDGPHAWSTWIRRTADAPGGYRILFLSGRPVAASMVSTAEM
jgi:hypothetical protein